MKKLVISDEAAHDIEEIYEFLYLRNARVAAELTAELIRIFQLLTEQPLMGKNRDELHPGLRSFPVGKHIIFYLINPGKIVIARVLHGARDLPTLFNN